MRTERAAEDQESAAELAERIHMEQFRRIEIREKRSFEKEKGKRHGVPCPYEDGRGIRTRAQTEVCATGLDEFEAGEEIANFEGGGVGGVGAVSAIVADAGAEIVADGAGGGFLGVGGAHGVAPF